MTYSNNPPVTLADLESEIEQFDYEADLEADLAAQESEHDYYAECQEAHDEHVAECYQDFIRTFSTFVAERYAD